MPRLAVFPKAFIDALCVSGSMSLGRWIDLAATLDVDGLEFYGGFTALQDPSDWARYRARVEEAGLVMPMLCCSPDFVHPESTFRREQVNRQKWWIDMTEALGGAFCRVLSGQRRPNVTRADGLRYASECIDECAEYAVSSGVTLILENHYKDDFWTYPEFAQHLDVFLDLLERVDVAVNFDPSNALLVGDDPLDWLRSVRHRVATMHASDRYLAFGTLEDLRCEESTVGYARRLVHGEIGHGLVDWDAVFGELRSSGFDGWISIEDGVEGLEQLRRSARFLRNKMAEYWP